MVEESAAEAAAVALGQLEVGEKPEEVAGSSETENLTVSEDGPKEEEDEDGPPNGTAKRDKTNSSQRVVSLPASAVAHSNAISASVAEGDVLMSLYRNAHRQLKLSCLR